MRVAIFCNDYWPTIGGVQTAVRGLTAGLRGRGHDVLVLTRQPGATPAEELVGGTPVRRFEWNLAPLPTFPWRAHQARAAVRRVVSDWGASAIYVHFVSVHALFAWDCARALGAPLVLSFRGNDVMRIAPRSAVTRRAYAALTRAADVNLFCSPWLLRQGRVAAWFQGRPDRTGVLADAVDVADRVEVGASREVSYVLAGGRMVPKKGFDLLVRAWASVGATIGVPLWLAGDGPCMDQLRHLVGELGVADRIRFLGPVPHPELLGLLERAALCVVPSREEPFGILVLEAQALGTPVLATQVGNIPELITSGRTGYLAPPTAEGLADALVQAWRDPQRQAVGRAGRMAEGARRDYATMAAELEDWLSRPRVQLDGAVTGIEGA